MTKFHHNYNAAGKTQMRHNEEIYEHLIEAVKMSKAHIAMLLTNPYRPDPRVLKEANSLASMGYKVTIICWDRNKEYPSSETIDGINIKRIAIKSGYSVGSKQILYLPKFWQLALKKVRELKPDIIHCHDLDTTPIGYLYSLRYHTPWIFDAHECYPEQMKSQVNLPIYYILLALERFVIPQATHVITVGELLAQRFRNFGGKVSIVGNYACINQSIAFKLTRADLDIPPDNLVVAYIGGFTKDRLIMPLMYASKQLSNITILLVGDGLQRQAIEIELPTYPQTIYVGQIPAEQVSAYTNLTDIIYYGLKAQNKNNHYSTPNALFNAITASKPILTTNVGEIAQIVRDNACGIVVDDATPNSLSTAIKQLKSETVRQRMSKNAYNLARSKYRWRIAEKTLLDIYTNLLIS